MALNGIRAVFFDLDGTLIHSAPDITAALNGVLAGESLPPQPMHRVLGWIGRGPEKLVESALARAEGSRPPPRRVSEITGRYLDAYYGRVSSLTRVYDGAREVLDQLSQRAMPMACVTNKMERLTRPVLEALGLASYFSVTLCADSLAQRKPAPEPLWRAAQLLDLPIESCVMVGDSVNDIQSGRAAGCPVVAVSWGYGRGADLRAAGADGVIDSLPELLQLLH